MKDAHGESERISNDQEKSYMDPENFYEILKLSLIKEKI